MKPEKTKKFQRCFKDGIYKCVFCDCLLEETSKPRLLQCYHASCEECFKASFSVAKKMYMFCKACEKIVVSSNKSPLVGMACKQMAKSRNNSPLVSKAYDQIVQSQCNSQLVCKDFEQIVQSRNYSQLVCKDFEQIVQSRNNSQLVCKDFEQIVQSRNNSQLLCKDFDQIVQSQCNSQLVCKDFEQIVQSRNYSQLHCKEYEQIVQSRNNSQLACKDFEQSVRSRRNNPLVCKDCGYIVQSGKNRKLICKACKDDSIASGFCVDCQDWLCQLCLKAHRCVKFTKTHTIKIVWDDKSIESKKPVTMSGLWCAICHDIGQLIVCTNCQRRYHSHCYINEIIIPTGMDWKCLMCLDIGGMPFSHRSYEPEQTNNLEVRKRNNLLIQRFVLEMLCHPLSGPYHAPLFHTMNMINNLRIFDHLSSIKEKLSIDHYIVASEFLGDLKKWLKDCLSLFENKSKVHTDIHIIDRFIVNSIARLFPEQYHALPKDKNMNPYFLMKKSGFVQTWNL